MYQRIVGELIKSDYIGKSYIIIIIHMQKLGKESKANTKAMVMCWKEKND